MRKSGRFCASVTSGFGKLSGHTAYADVAAVAATNPVRFASKTLPPACLHPHQKRVSHLPVHVALLRSQVLLTCAAHGSIQ